ncbi:class I histocompatibility antigen, F10 alpha chain-like isoform X2 [Dendropsophus ebraccatus]
MKDNLGPEHWERETQIDQRDEILFRHEVRLWRKRFNHTEGLHFTQVITGCDLRDEGTSIIYEQYRSDGEEIMFYDTKTESFIPTMAKAQTVTQRWNRPETGRVERTKVFLKNICIEKLRRYIEYGREDLERRVPPRVKVIGRESGGITKLHCLVYGFHPRAVDVKWMKNGTDDVPTYESTNILPNPDGTYQIRVTAEVILKDGDSYSCYVDHSSLEEPLLVRWDLKRDFPRVSTIIVVVIIFLILASGIAVLRTNKTSDTSHEESPAAPTLDITLDESGL